MESEIPSQNKEFIQELEQLMNKYKVKIVRNDEYDGEDSPSGTSYTFEGPTINVEIADLAF